MPAPRPAGTTAWIDLDTTDVDDARRFYSELFGWTLETQDTPMGPYTVASSEDGPVGGLMARPKERAVPGMPAVWTVFFATADVDSTITTAKALGGTVVQEPMEVPGGDRIAVVADPVGGMFGLVQSNQPEGIAWGTPGAMAWVECGSRDLAVSRSFYESVFGWKATEGTGGYWLFEHDSQPVAGLMNMPDGVPDEVPTYWLAYWAVGDVDAACTAAGKLGGRVAVPTMNIDEGTFAVVEDPQGGVFAVYADAATGG